MTLALATKSHIATIDAKRDESPSGICSIASPSTGICWSRDNAQLFMSTANTVVRCSSSGTPTQTIYKSKKLDGKMSHLLSRGDSHLVFAQGTNVHVLDIITGAITSSFTSQKSEIISLALSSDSTLVASISATGSVHIGNLGTGTTGTLRGLAGVKPTIGVFHAHLTSRLLLGTDTQLLVYDIARPAGIQKTIEVGSTVVGISCSPFSKTLVAVALLNGAVGLVDLDKEKPLFRTLDMKCQLSSIAFSPEGASVYIGTIDGRVLVIDLRALDKSPKSITVSQSLEAVAFMSIQRKIKSSRVMPEASVASDTKSAKSTTVTNTKLKATRVPSASVNPATTIKNSRAATKSDVSSTENRAPITEKVTRPKDRSSTVLSSARDPFGNAERTKDSFGDISMDMEKLGIGRIAQSTNLAIKFEKAKLGTSSASQHVGENPPPKTRPSRPVSMASSGFSMDEHYSSNSQASSSKYSGSSRIDTATARTQRPARVSRTPSPDSPSMEASVPKAISMNAKGKGNGVESSKGNRWMQTGKGDIDERKVGFADEEEEKSIVIRRSADIHGLNHWLADDNRTSRSGPSPSTHGSGAAQELLRNIMQDALFDFQRETKEQMVGLHLDLVRMGRGWKNELRGLAGDMHELREENKRLREENERLKRGY